MNKNTLVGLLIIAVILFGFSWYNSSQYEKALANKKAEEREQFVRDSTTLANAPKPVAVVLTPEQITADSIAAVQAKQLALGVLAPAYEGVEEFKTLENKRFKIKFSNKGGRIASVELKEYNKYGGDPLMLFTEEDSNFGISLYTPELSNTADLYFEARAMTDTTITYRMVADSVNYMEFNYKIKPDDFIMDMSFDLSHFKGVMALNQPDLKLDWKIVSPQQEKGFKNENSYTTIAYKYPISEDVEEIGMSDEAKSAEVTSKVQWVDFKQQFFSSIIISKESFTKSNLSFTTFAANDKKIKEFSASLLLPYTPQTTAYNFNFYFGPNKYSTLKAYPELELQKLVPLGWGIFGWVNRWIVIPTFDFLGGFISNFGIVILLLTLFIKLLILPLTYKSYLSTAKMRLLKPDIDKLAEKYPNKADAMKKQQATMEVYKKAGVSPMGGCLPLLIQMPILFAMFRFFPSAIELRQKAFLWADDLSSYDSIWDFPGGFNLPFYGDHISLFTLLMAIILYVNAKLTASQQPMGSAQMPGMQFMMLYAMPVMFLFLFNNNSSGLSWYYFLSTAITILQTYLFRFAVNDNKLHSQMKENAKKPIVKSKWALRMEEMQKQAAAQQKAKKAKR